MSNFGLFTQQIKNMTVTYTKQYVKSATQNTVDFASIMGKKASRLITQSKDQAIEFGKQKVTNYAKESHQQIKEITRNLAKTSLKAVKKGSQGGAVWGAIEGLEYANKKFSSKELTEENNKNTSTNNSETLSNDSVEQFDKKILTDPTFTKIFIVSMDQVLDHLMTQGLALSQDFGAQMDKHRKIYTDNYSKSKVADDIPSAVSNNDINQANKYFKGMSVSSADLYACQKSVMDVIQSNLPEVAQLLSYKASKYLMSSLVKNTIDVMYDYRQFQKQGMTHEDSMSFAKESLTKRMNQAFDKTSQIAEQQQIVSSPNKGQKQI